MHAYEYTPAKGWEKEANDDKVLSLVSVERAKYGALIRVVPRVRGTDVRFEASTRSASSRIRAREEEERAGKRSTTETKT